MFSQLNADKTEVLIVASENAACAHIKTNEICSFEWSTRYLYIHLSQIILTPVMHFVCCLVGQVCLYTHTLYIHAQYFQ